MARRSNESPNHLFVFVILSGLAISSTPFILLFYDAHESLLVNGQVKRFSSIILYVDHRYQSSDHLFGKFDPLPLVNWQAIEAKLLQWFYPSLCSAQNQALTSDSGQILLDRSSEQILDVKGVSLTIAAASANRETQSRQETIQVAETEKTVSSASAGSLNLSDQPSAKDESDLFEFLTQGQYHRRAETDQGSAMTVTIGSSSPNLSESLSKRSEQPSTESVLITQAFSGENLSGKASDLMPLDSQTLDQSLPHSPNSASTGSLNLSDQPSAKDESDLFEFLTRGQYHRRAETDQESAMTVTIGSSSPKVITQIPAQEFFLPNTRLAPFTTFSTPAIIDTWEIPTTTIKLEIDSSGDRSIAQIPAQEFLSADTQLAPFTTFSTPAIIDTWEIPTTTIKLEIDSSGDRSIAQIPAQEFLSADTQLAPFTTFSTPAIIDTWEIPTTTIKLEIDSSGDRSIAQIPAQEFLSADTQLAPFTIPATPAIIDILNDLELNQNIINAPVFGIVTYKEISQLNLAQTGTSDFFIPKDVPTVPVPPVPEIIKPEEEVPSQSPLTEEQLKIKDIAVKSFLESVAVRYPFIVNTNDLLTINPYEYRPTILNFYVNLTFDLDQYSLGNQLNFKEFNDPLLKNFNFSYYPNNQQFYWLYDNNVMIETNGFHGNINYQGNVITQKSRQTAISTIPFFGVQTVFALPQAFESARGFEKDNNNLNITSGAVEVVSPQGVPGVPQVVFNINGEIEVVSLDDTRKASTFTEQGGDSYFGNLDAENAPKFLQGFPTINFQGLLDNKVRLQIGQRIPLENLAKIGVTVGDFFTTAGFNFNQSFSSLPGVKTLQFDKGFEDQLSRIYASALNLDSSQLQNNDIVALMSNPFLTQEQRDFHYLNSLIWYSGGQRAPEITTRSFEPETHNWYRYIFNYSQNRTLLKYHPEKVELSYTNVFANPGVSLTVSPFLSDVDERQMVNATLGLALGGLFYLLNPNDINGALTTARQKYEENQAPESFSTQSTSADRRAMNLRLNNSLQNANLVSQLNQVSGSYTITDHVTPNSSLLFQLRTGTYQRAVQFFSREIGEWTPESPLFFSVISPNDFGPLAYTGVNVPIEFTNIEPLNRTSFAFIKIQNGEGDVLLKQQLAVQSEAFTALPIVGPGKAADIEFGRIEISRFRQREFEDTSYIGYLYLPALEFILSGTSKGFSYSLSLGAWTNLYPQSSPQIDENISDLQEKTVGIFSSINLRWNFNNIWYNKNKQWETIISNSPLVNFSWNSSPNRLNISSANFGNVFQFVRQNWNLTWFSNFSFSPQELNAAAPKSSLGNISYFSSLNFSESSGLNIIFPISFGDKVFYSVEATYPIIKDQKLGSTRLGFYYSNYSVATRGFDNQFEDPNYGLVIKYNNPSSLLSIEAYLGHSDSGFRGRIQSSINFKF
ncbi:hypothetical protein [Microcystis aeruginosa]|uniref:hypothetical protein n=1 Tax=Microcystis aeruginosa TaxID=1126 RepID=UPI00292E7128|nr:hypothetical protein [Microcystis aeruginosa]WOB66824.1 hypothetical protein PJW00_14445 [Microcystis aeruginosa LE3]